VNNNLHRHWWRCERCKRFVSPGAVTCRSCYLDELAARAAKAHDDEMFGWYSGRWLP
jgi:hypothetical protein